MKSNSWTISGSNFIGELVRFLGSFFNSYFSMAVSKLGRTGIAMVIFYFVSLDKPEFTQFAQTLSARTTLDKCFSTAWRMSLGSRYGGEDEKLAKFLQENCSNIEWNFNWWLKRQSKKVEKLFKCKEDVTDK